MTIYLVTLLAMLNQIGFAGSKVAVSLYALELGASQMTVGTIIALYSLCPAMLAITIGKFSDRVPPRLPVIVGCVGSGIALALPPVFASLVSVFVLSILIGTCHQIFSLPLEANIGGLDGPDKRARNYSVLTMGWAIATSVGPVISGLAIDYLGYAQCFIMLAVFSVLPAIVLWTRPRFLATAAHKNEKKAAHRGSVFGLWSLPSLRNTMLAGAIIGSAKDLFQFYMPIYGHSIGLTASAIGTIIGMVALASFVIRGLIPLLLHKLHETEILISAVFVAALAFALLPFFSNPYMLAAIAFLLGLGVGSAEPMTLSLFYVLSPKGRNAEALGLHKTIRLVTQLVVPVVFGGVGSSLGYFVVFLSNTAMLVTGGTLLRKVAVPMNTRV